MYNEVYFDSDSEEDTPSKHNIIPLTTQTFHNLWLWRFPYYSLVYFYSFLCRQLHWPEAETADYTNEWRAAVRPWWGRQGPGLGWCQAETVRDFKGITDVENNYFSTLCGHNQQNQTFILVHSWSWLFCRYNCKKRTATTSQPQPPHSQALPNSDAILNCPACMTTLCLDCQRWELIITRGSVCGNQKGSCRSPAQWDFKIIVSNNLNRLQMFAFYLKTLNYSFPSFPKSDWNIVKVWR